jgi:hypothetical protein
LFIVAHVPRRPFWYHNDISANTSRWSSSQIKSSIVTTRHFSTRQNPTIPWRDIPRDTCGNQYTREAAFPIYITLQQKLRVYQVTINKTAHKNMVEAEPQARAAGDLSMWLSITEITSPPVVTAPITGLLTDPSETRTMPSSRTSSSRASGFTTSTSTASHLLPAEASIVDPAAASTGSSRTTTDDASLTGTAEPSSSSPADQQQTAEDRGGGGGGLSTNMAAGIGVGSTLAGILILVLIGLYVHLRKRRASSDHLHDRVRAYNKQNQLRGGREVESCTSFSRCRHGDKI